MAYAISGGALIQSNLGDSGNFETVVFAEVEPDAPNPPRPLVLRHHWKNTSRPDRGWRYGRVISDRAVDAGALIQIGCSSSSPPITSSTGR